MSSSADSIEQAQVMPDPAKKSNAKRSSGRRPINYL